MTDKDRENIKAASKDRYNSFMRETLIYTGFSQNLLKSTEI